MQKVVLIFFVAISVCGFGLQRFFKNQEANEQRQISELAENKKFKSRVQEFSKATGATWQWMDNLSGESGFISTPILSIDLEREWVHNGPIFFEGWIADIASINEQEYIVKFAPSNWLDMDLYQDAMLKLSLFVKKEVVDDFLKNHPACLEETRYGSCLLVAAEIEEIQLEEHYALDREGDAKMIIVRTGIGKLIGMEFIDSYTTR